MSLAVNSGVPYQWMLSTCATYFTAESAGGTGGIGAGAGGAGIGDGSTGGAGGTGAGAGGVACVWLGTAVDGAVGPPPHATVETDSAATTNALQHNSLRTLHLAKVMVHRACRTGSALQVARPDRFS
jgi:hypothetical protein